MKNKLLYLLTFIMILSIGILTPMLSVYADNTVYIHISPNGIDTNNGTENKPLATLDGARRFIANNYPDKEKPIVALFHKGEYIVDKTVNFSNADSGTASAPITYKSAGDGDVVFTGGVHLDINQFKQITDKSINNRIPEIAQGRVYELNLLEQGLSKTDLAYVKESATSRVKPYGLYLNGKKMDLARWPNVGYELVTEVVNDGKSGQEGVAAFRYSGTRPNGWLQAKDVSMDSITDADYTNEGNKIKSIDTVNKIITVENKLTIHLPENKWAVENLLEEIDMPGEYYIDQESGKLYIYPPYLLNKENDTLVFAKLRSEMVSLTDVKYLNFDGLKFMYSYGITGGGFVTKGYAFYNFQAQPNDMDHIAIKNCTFRYLGGTGLKLNGKNLIIESNDFFNLGGAATDIRGGSVANLTPGNNLIQNNHAYDNGAYEIYSTTGAYNVFRNNLSHRSRFTVMMTGGTGNQLLYNEGHNSLRYVGDNTIFGVGRTWLAWDTVFQYNYAHDFGAIDTKTSGLPTYGFFLDDTATGVTVKNNIINPNYKDGKTRSMVIGGGAYNNVSDNIVLNASYGLEANERVMGKTDMWTYHAYTYVAEYGVKYEQEPWVSKYPHLKEIMNWVDTNGTHMPWNNVGNDNVFVNVQAGTSIGQRHPDNGGIFKNNMQLEESEMDIFVDVAKQDFRIKDSAVKELKISPNVINESNFDFNLIGLQREVPLPNEPFYQLYPQNGSSNLDAKNVQLKTEWPHLADEFYYIVAKDFELKDVVAQGRTFESVIKLPQLENGTKYYWKIKAKSVSLRMQNEWDSVGKPFSFTTSINDYKIECDWNLLKSQIDLSKEYLTKINEGEESGQHKIGTTENLTEQIAIAQKSLDDKIIEDNSKLEVVLKALKNALMTAKTEINLSYATLDVTEANKWKVSDGEYASVVVNDGVLQFQRKSADKSPTMMAPVSSGQDKVFTFDTKTNIENGWIGYGFSNKMADTIYSGMDNSYRVLIKKNQFELQSTGQQKSIYIESPNNGIFKSDVWHRIEFGIVPVDKSVLVIFKVDGKTVFEYLDANSDPMFFTPYFHTMAPQFGTTMEIRTPADAPTGPYTVESSSIAGNYFDTNYKGYEEVGEWSTLEDAVGYKDNRVRVAKSKKANASWFISTDEGKTTKKIYYYHIPMKDGDKNAKMKIESYDVITGFERKIDFSKGQEGWVYLGDMFLVNAGHKLEVKINFESSGEGVMPISNIMFAQGEIDGKEQRFTEIFTKWSRDSMLLKVGSSIGFVNVEKIAIPDAAPTIYNDRTLVPLRFVSEQFGATVSWDEKTNSAKIEMGDTVVSMTVNSAEYTVNDKSLTLDQAPIIVNGRMMVPLRALAESVDKKVYYNDKDQLILIGRKVDLTDENVDLLGFAVDKFNEHQ